MHNSRHICSAPYTSSSPMQLWLLTVFRGDSGAGWMRKSFLMILIGSEEWKVKSHLQRISERPHADTPLQSARWNSVLPSTVHREKTVLP